MDAVKVIGLATGAYGAILSTVLAAMKYRGESERLSVHADIAQVTIEAYFPADGAIPSTWDVTVEGEEPETENHNPPFVRVKVINIGRVAVMIGRIGGAYADGKIFTATYDPIPLPKRLDPGEHFNFAVQPSAVRHTLRFLAAWNTAGKVWKVPKKETASIRSLASDFHATDSS